LGLATVPTSSTRKGISEVKLSHTRSAVSAVFDDPNLVSAAGLVPVLALAETAGLARLARLAQQQLTVPTDRGAKRRVEGVLAGRGDAGRRGHVSRSVCEFVDEFGLGTGSVHNMTQMTTRIQSVG
jgi:hypothetical protein